MDDSKKLLIVAGILVVGFFIINGLFSTLESSYPGPWPYMRVNGMANVPFSWDGTGERLGNIDVGVYDARDDSLLFAYGWNARSSDEWHFIGTPDMVSEAKDVKKLIAIPYYVKVLDGGTMTGDAREGGVKFGRKLTIAELSKISVSCKNYWKNLYGNEFSSEIVNDCEIKPVITEQQQEQLGLTEEQQLEEETNAEEPTGASDVVKKNIFTDSWNKLVSAVGGSELLAGGILIFAFLLLFKILSG